jgi:regulator of protease activity HflC (stomatin/prohibitin superfamily)
MERNTRAVMERAKLFIRRNQVFFIILGLVTLFVVIYFAPSIFVTIRAGEAGVMYRRFFGGTVRGRVYGEGLHLVWPWDKLTVYNVRIQETRHELDVLDRTGLRFRLAVSIRFRPEYEVLGVLHQAVGPNYVQTIVIPEVESVLRTTAGSFDAAQLYNTSHSVLSRIVNEALAGTLSRFVIIDDVIIRTIILPETIRIAIEHKREQEQLAEAYVYRLQREQDEAKRRVIEAIGIADAHDIVSGSLNPDILKWQGIQATMEISTSTNSKVVVIGNGTDGLPVILGADK